MYKRPTIWGVIFIAVLMTACGEEPEDAETTAAASITVPELRDHMYYLASDELEGRMPGETGYDVAAQYCASQFRQAGLVPLCLDADGNKTYLQQVRIITKTRRGDSKLRIKTDENLQSLRCGDDFFFRSPGVSEEIELSGTLVFVGYGVHEPDHGWDDYSGIDVEGKWVVYMFGDPDKEGVSVLPEDLAKSYSSGIEGFLKKGMTAFEAGALGVIIVNNQERFRMWDILKHATRKQCSLPGHDPLLQCPCVEVMINEEPLNRLFQDRPYNPLTQKGEYGSFAMENVTLSLDARETVKEIRSANVVAMVEGTDPRIRDEYITVGAHLDHVGRNGGEIFNGADDDASGCVAVLEVAEAVALDPPGHSVIFVLYTGEELRFMGSQHFVLNPPVPLENIRANINLDMVGRSDGAARELATNVGGEKASVLREIISDVNQRMIHLRLDYAYDQYFMMSDHVSFYLSGIPVVFFHNGDHADLHKATDDADKIDYDFLKKVSQLTYFLTLELASHL
jgi:hypothetical protein